MYAQVAPLLPIECLEYSIPAKLQESIKIGVPVTIPLKNKKIIGYVTHIASSTDAKFNIKEIDSVAKDYPTYSTEIMNFYRWINSYYHYPTGIALKAGLPPILKHPEIKKYFAKIKLADLTNQEIEKLKSRGGKQFELLQLIENKNGAESIPGNLKNAAKTLLKKDFIEAKSIETTPKSLTDNYSLSLTKKINPNEEQSTAINTIKSSINREDFECFLLKGVTGSGKTEVYLNAAEHVLKKGKNVLFLVPEISLTPQLFSRVLNRFPSSVALLHSGLTDRKKSEQWHLIKDGLARVVLGARSAIFSPLENIGLIIVDEEHESAFKQEDRLRYNARDMAILKAKYQNAVVLLGSATPSFESYYLCLSGKIQFLELKKRVAGAKLPEIETVMIQPNDYLLTGRLISEMKRTLQKNKQCLLFLNRKGFSSFLSCSNCKETIECPNCSVSLTKYSFESALECHYCGYRTKIPKTCPKCGNEQFVEGLAGTEKIEAICKEFFPEAQIVRIDKKTCPTHKELENKLNLIAEDKTDIIIGTQMIAKGHDFPNIELVGIICADNSFNLPDFRATEKSYQLFTQVAGRAGRTTAFGKVIIQTFNAEHPSIRYTLNDNYSGLAESELQLRESFQYPPYYRIARILITSNDPIIAERIAQNIALEIRACKLNHFYVLGPAPANMRKIKNKHRWNILLKSKTATDLNKVLKTYFPRWKSIHNKKAHINIDVDPQTLM